MLEIIPLVLGPVSTNCYLIADSETGEVVVIDPAWDGGLILAEIRKHNWKITGLWITHAHFDHFYAVGELASECGPNVTIALHKSDLPLYLDGGLGPVLGYEAPPLPDPTEDLSTFPILSVGRYPFFVKHTPGHSPGSCSFYSVSLGILFSGDLIFYHSVGRTDLPGGDQQKLLDSIRSLFSACPKETRVLSGHGEETTLGDEKSNNPYVHT